MADIRPFRGYHARPDLAAKVASPPYDVLDTEEARTMAAANPLSFLHVVKAEIDLDPGVDAHGDPVYERSAVNLRRFIDEGTLQRDEAECFYIYRLAAGGHEQFGLAAGCSLDEYERGLIKKHELTRRDKEDDRARHMEILQANAGPVLFTYRAADDIKGLVKRCCEAAAPRIDFRADDGVRHSLWVLGATDDIAALRGAFAAVESIYVADGHHRSAAALRVRNIMRARNADHDGSEPYNHFLAVLFPDDELRLQGYHRVLKDLNGLGAEDFMAKLGDKFSVESTDTPEPPGQQQFGMYLDGRWFRVAAKPGTFPADDPVRSLDGSILQENLLGPVFGIGDPRSDPRIDFVGGVRGTQELERRCAADMRLAFAFAPVSVAQIMAISDAGAVMPPKSTWFEPKLRSGLLVRSLVD